MSSAVPESPTVAVIGAGAVGAYYGAMLARAGFDVHFLMRSDYSAVREHGLKIQSYRGDFELAPSKIHAYDDVAKMPGADIVLVALKTTANHLFESFIRPLLKRETAIMTMQNGLGNEEDLATLFGAERVLGAIAFVGNYKLEPGLIRHTSAGWVRVGEFGRPAGERARRICAMFTQSGVECEVIESLLHGRWQKNLWNIPFNGLGAAMDLSIDRVLASPQGTELVADLMRESMSVAAKLNLTWPADYIDKTIRMTRGIGAYKTSMQVDRQHRRPLEIEAIFGRPLRVARDLGATMPLTESIYRLLTLLS